MLRQRQDGSRSRSQLMREELGARWLAPDVFRLGASSMLADIERQLDHQVTGRYAAGYRHAMA